MHLPATMATLAPLLMLLMAAAANAASFGASVRSTRCNTDPNRGEVNNPCGSLYDAECGGEYCRCPVGTGVHPNLRRCVRGYDDDHDDNGNDDQGSQSDLFDDLPFDYVPPGSKPADTPRRTDDDETDVSDIRCGATFDPCPTRHNAVCSSGRCRCPLGTKESSTAARCVADPSYNHNGNQDRRDYDNGDYDDDDDNNVWFFGSSATKPAVGFHVFMVAGLGMVMTSLLSTSY